MLGAGVVIAATRCFLWVALLLADKAWLTNNDTSIAGTVLEPVSIGYNLAKINVWRRTPWAFLRASRRERLSSHVRTETQSVTLSPLLPRRSHLPLGAMNQAVARQDKGKRVCTNNL